MAYYIIYNVEDQAVFGTRDTEQAALDRCKFLAEKNIGREYVAMQSIRSYKCKHENISMVEQELS